MENKQKNIKECEVCESNATCLCFKCLQYFCDSCYKLIHDKKKNSNSNHKKDNLDPFVPIDLKCPEHSTNHLNLFCLDEKGKFI